MAAAAQASWPSTLQAGRGAGLGYSAVVMRLTRAGSHRPYFWLAPVKDLLQVGLWLGAFAGNTIEWRGVKMRLRPDGTLANVPRTGKPA